jgi:hypothetical protein
MLAPRARILASEASTKSLRTSRGTFAGHRPSLPPTRVGDDVSWLTFLGQLYQTVILVTLVLPRGIRKTRIGFWLTLLLVEHACGSATDADRLRCAGNPQVAIWTWKWARSRTDHNQRPADQGVHPLPPAQPCASSPAIGHHMRCRRCFPPPGTRARAVPTHRRVGLFPNDRWHLGHRGDSACPSP